ncbi:ATP-binding cassette domain-containing protein [Streptomonospora sp. S1-112]|uniref:ATP-binding cassette domain-containing protein n=1 Tax=Streptomonospora mangrovi TaxID=2883123 RepID=A0A9X3NNV5_9ACTN|nr:ATP-binding cassette domain-containing protein [Streptomonospora mangrovi]MDA0565608.1 ATP-binding cassette domain-containing protein [Streptomonospora mangrovi]
MLDLRQVTKTYRVGAFGGERLHAVRGVDLAVAPGEVVSLIGESGSGKSTIGKMVLRLIAPSAGAITFEGRDVAAVRGHRATKEYYRRVQGVFQDPFSCFNPVFTADRVFGLIRAEYHRSASAAAWRARVEEALATVRLDPAQVMGKYPHQLSGGQLQRLLIARALLLDIRMLVADEIISMLDASTRIDVLNLLGDLKARGLGILFITHDLSLGNYISDTAVILRRGRVVEKGPTGEVFAAPAHPYTRRLLSSVPQLHTTWEQADAALRAGGERACPGCARGGQPGAHGPVELAPGHHVGCFTAQD